LVSLAWSFAASKVAARSVAVELDALYVDVQGLRSALRKLSGGEGRRTRDERGVLDILAKLQAAPPNGKPQEAAQLSRADILARAGLRGKGQ